MGEYINATYDHAKQWAAELSWMRVNIGYYLSELDDLKHELELTDEEVAGEYAFFGELASILDNHAALEIELFKMVHTYEILHTPEAIDPIIPALETLKNARQSWFEDYDRRHEVCKERYENNEKKAALTMVKLTEIIGAEMLGASMRASESYEAAQELLKTQAETLRRRASLPDPATIIEKLEHFSRIGNDDVFDRDYSIDCDKHKETGTLYVNLTVEEDDFMTGDGFNRYAYVPISEEELEDLKNMTTREAFAYIQQISGGRDCIDATGGSGRWCSGVWYPYHR